MINFYCPYGRLLYNEIWLATPFSLLKREWINRFKITDYKHAYRLIFEYIEAFYNTTRIHSHCEYISPNEYEKRDCKKLRQLEIEVA